MKKTNFRLFMVIIGILLSINTMAYDFVVDGICYNIVSIQDLTCEIAEPSAEYKNNYSGNFRIPSSVKYNGKTLTVVSIGEGAFTNDDLISVYIPNTVVSIGYNAFWCNNLQEITIPKSVKRISYQVIRCPVKVNITSLESWFEIEYPLTSAPSFLFQKGGDLCLNGKIITDLVIPNTIKEIKGRAFSGCTSLTSVSFEKGTSIEEIGEDAFSSCKNIKRVEIPKSVIYLKGSAFAGIPALEEVILEDGETNLLYDSDDYYHKNISPFAGDENIKTIHLGRKASSVQSDDYHRLFGKGTYLGSYVYLNVENLSIGDVFDNVIIADGKNPPRGENQIRYYGIEAKNLKSLTLGKNIENVTVYNTDVENAIYLTTKTPPTLDGYGYFSNATYINSTLYVPQGSSYLYKSTEGWKNFWNIVEYNATAIDEIKTENTITEVGIISLDGRSVEKYQKGINIIKYSDGTSKKVFVK
ncbi:MAG: leucine-rich repeat domain-containing protein [Bacteroidaceae bacterium]|nr:leucine-rich repeat domain-containing protein [Bacteroidaceae bacterium]